MGNFYVDDSIHDEAGFIIGACTYSDIDVNEKIADVIKLHKFDPETFEYKSSANYYREPEKAKVREGLKKILRNDCKLGLVIIPRENRGQLGFECIKAIKQFIDINKEIKTPTSIYFDQGMFNSMDKANKLINSLNFTDCSFLLEQDSKEIRGIQLADLAAHISAIQLKYTLGLVSKKVKAGENSGYDPDQEMELGIEMWASIRYVFFTQVSKPFKDDPLDDAMLMVEPYGLYISDSCNETLSDQARQTFGEIYLGCIH